MKLHQSRKAFSMITAIFVIVIMASVGAFIMNLSGKMIKGTTTQFQREQAMLLAKSYTEYAIMAVMANDTTTNCLNTITGTALGLYTIEIDIAYLGGATRVPVGCTTLSSTVTFPVAAPSLNIIVDVYVRYQDLDNPAGTRMTYHKRTLQKI